MSNTIVSPECKAKMIQDYLNGMTQAQLAAQFGCAQTTCSKILKLAGVTTRSNGETHRKYQVEQSFFEVIDTEAKAYWLGFLTADATILDRGFVVALNHSDMRHLEKLKAALGSTHPIKMPSVSVRGKTYQTCNIFIGSNQLAASLDSLGVTQHKSATCKPCQAIPEHLVVHYWRGVFDGDGFICPNKGKKWIVGIVGTYDIAEGFRAFFSPLITSHAQVCPHHNIFSIRFSGTTLSQMVLQHLYRGSTVYMDRKYKLYQELDSQIAKSGQKFACGASSTGVVGIQRETACDEAGTKVL